MPAPSLRPQLDPLRRKPMAKAARVTLFEREVRVRLSSAALDILLDSAEVLSEGQRVRAIRGSDSVYGSTMLTMNLDRVGEQIREECSEATARRVAELMTSDPRLGAQLRALTQREASRVAGVTVTGLTLDMRVRTLGATVFVDIDFEGST